VEDFMERKSPDWFLQRRKNKGVEIAHEQVTKAFDTVNWLNKATKCFSEKKYAEAKRHIENLYKTEAVVDSLRTEAFMELSKGAALMADYREDLLHIIKRADMLADHTKDAARCIEMLWDAEVPAELLDETVLMTDKLVSMVQILKGSVDKINSDTPKAVREAQEVNKIEHEVDVEYLKTRSLFIKYGENINHGVMVILDDMIDFLEQAADTCADTADYIVVLSSRE
jgi:predicted phosphate transport protein (TIGR00153 family)